jgi:predicted ATPase/DNA-binding NarL/FixJ family response regulator
MNRRVRVGQAETSLGSRDHQNLPIQVTTFIGREQEITEIQRLLATTHLLTLTGSPGVGKTRLALETALRQRDCSTGSGQAYADGFWLVELAALADPALVPQTAATALGLPENPRRPLVQTLVDFLKPRAMMLLLDNCEHLIDACAALAESLLRACPRLRILATSREALRIAGETCLRVPSLTLPNPRQLARTDHLTAYEAVRLFLDRAAAAAPGFVLTDQNASALAQVCQRLDGIPLAIELAAVRVKVLSPGEIAARLNDRFRLLAAGSRMALPRQQTLRALVDWSHDLLSEPERILFRRLSVFAGGWTLAAAEATCAFGVGTDAGPELSPEEVLDLLGILVDKSLVVAEQHLEGTRYRLLETLRQYAAEKLRAAGEEARVRRRHRDWFAGFVGRQLERLSGPQQAEAFARLDAEHDNLRAALDWCEMEPGGWEAGAQLADELRWFWGLRGYVREGRERLDRLLALATEPTAGRARALSAAGNLAQHVGEYDRAAALLEESVGIWRELGDERGAAVALARLGQLEQSRGDYDRAWMLLEESRRMCPDVGTVSGLDAPRAVYLAQVAKNRGDHARAIPLFEECLGQARARGDRHAASSVLRSLGELTQARGDYERAAGYLRESLLLIRELNDQACALTTLDSLAVLAAARGDSVRAARLFAAAGASRAAQSRSLPSTEQDRLDRAAANARDRLGMATFDTAWSEGRAMTLEQAIGAALTLDEPTNRERRDPHETPTGSQAALLTCRERDVADLIARGYTNRQIAAELVISERTVHAHVRNILAKLGFTSRAQVAAWAAQEGWLKTQPR